MTSLTELTNNRQLQIPNNAPTNNDRIRGFTIDTLDSMVYNSSVSDEPDSETECNVRNNNIQCNYILPKDIHLTNTGVNLMSLNIRSMQANFDNFIANLFEIEPFYDVIGICETRMIDSTVKLYKIDRYNLYSNNVSSSKGGVCLYVRDCFSCKIREDLLVIKEHIETLFLEIMIDNKPLLIGMIYRRPDTSFDRFINDFSVIINTIK